MEPGAPQLGESQSAAQRYVKSSWSMDAGIFKRFLKNNAGIDTFSVSDIFGTRRMDQYSEIAFFIMQTHRLEYVPIFRLNQSLRFRMMDLSLLKHNIIKGEMNGTQGAMQGL
jgi:ferric enterobactin receptor